MRARSGTSHQLVKLPPVHCRPKLHTSYDPAQSCGLANVEIEGLDPGKIAGYLWEKRRIIVTPIGHPACTGLRVTPNVYTTLDEVDTFVAAMEAVIKNGLAWWPGAGWG